MMLSHLLIGLWHFTELCGIYQIIWEQWRSIDVWGPYYSCRNHHSFTPLPLIVISWTGWRHLPPIHQSKVNSSHWQIFVQLFHFFSVLITKHVSIIKVAELNVVLKLYWIHKSTMCKKSANGLQFDNHRVIFSWSTYACC